MLLAESQIGQREKVGHEDNPRILEYLRCTRLDEQALSDETAWCAAFVCWCLEKSQHKNPRNALARRLLKYGTEVASSDARFGDILVFSRGDDERKGHACFFVRDLGDEYEVLGGNQRNSVCYVNERKRNLLGVSRPVKL